jgi:hypothetical protein
MAGQHSVLFPSARAAHLVYPAPMPKYAEVPDETREEGDDERTPRARDEALAEASRGLRQAARAVGAPRGTEVEALLGRTDLPALAGDDPLRELATRLDAEADLWRNLAFREMARSAWASKLVTGLAIVVLALDAGLAAVAALGALFGAEAGDRSLLVLTAGGLLTAALAVVMLVVHVNRRGERDLVRSALARADMAELRLHRLGVALAWRKADEARYLDALGRLEKDAAG